MVFSKWLGVGLVLTLLCSCSQITVMRTKEFKQSIDSLGLVLHMQIDSLRKGIDSLRQEQRDNGLRSNADAGEISKEIVRNQEHIEGRLQELDASLQHLDEKLSKISQRSKKTDNGDVSSSVATPPSPKVDSAKLILQSELESLFQKGKTDYSAKKFKDAYQTFKSMYDKDSLNLFQEQSLYWMARCLDELNYTDESLKLYQALTDNYSKGDKICSVLWLKSRVYEKKKDTLNQKSTLKLLLDNSKCIGTNEAGLAQAQMAEIK